MGGGGGVGGPTMISSFLSLMICCPGTSYMHFWGLIADAPLSWRMFHSPVGLGITTRMTSVFCCLSLSSLQTASKSSKRRVQIWRKMAPRFIVSRASSILTCFMFFRPSPDIFAVSQRQHPRHSKIKSLRFQDASTPPNPAQPKTANKKPGPMF